MEHYFGPKLHWSTQQSPVDDPSTSAQFLQVWWMLSPTEHYFLRHYCHQWRRTKLARDSGTLLANGIRVGPISEEERTEAELQFIFAIPIIFCDLLIQEWAKKRSLGLVKFVAAVAYHFCLVLPAAFTQPGDHLLAKPCTIWLKV